MAIQETPKISEQLAAHIVGLHELDPDLVRLIDTFVFDYLGVTVNGTDRPSAEAARRASTLAESPDDLRASRIHGLDQWGILEEAALVNGITAHGPELDDTHEQASLHPAVVVMPVVFAYSDAHQVTSRTAYRAIAVGYDVMTAVGTLLGAAESYRRGFHPTAVCGTVGAAAAASVIMGLDHDQAKNAVSLAANMSAGSLEFLSDGSWTKRLNPGHSAATGLRAARLAQAGFAGPTEAFEGRDGFLRLFGEGPSSSRHLEIEFGRGVSDTSIKMYPCCRYMHGNIDLLRAIHAELPDLTLEEVEAIECGVITAGAALISLPPERKLIVSTPVDAQFNMPFGAAVALTSGDATVDQFANAAELAKDLHGWMEKVVCYESPRIEAAFPASWQAEVRVRLADGRVVEKYAEAYIGSPQRRASEAEIAAKAAALVSKEWAEAALRNIGDLEPTSRFCSDAILP
ncbi:MmgE/PrpD family protein [Leucobacter sp. GX24907]